MFAPLLRVLPFVAVVLGRRPEVVDSSYSFARFKVDFQRTYSSLASEAAAKEVFDENLKTILRHNAEEGRTWTMGVNEFTDWTAEDMHAVKGLNKALAFKRRAEDPVAARESKVDLKDLPSSVDWREKGVVTPIKNQGHCGSCWTFSATETLESHVAIATGYLFTLSEQQFVSCVENPEECGGTGGCEGATMEMAFQYAMDNGLTTEWTYPCEYTFCLRPIPPLI